MMRASRRLRHLVEGGVRVAERHKFQRETSRKFRAEYLRPSRPGTCTYILDGACASLRMTGDPTIPSLPIAPT
jgi:hypothetical protein